MARLTVSTRHVALALALLAAFVRVIHLSTILPTPLAEYHSVFAPSDMYLFDQWAQRIARGDVLGRERYHPLADWQLATAPAETWTEWYGREPIFYKAPFYPYLLASLYRIFGQAFLPVALLQIAASTLSVLLLFGIGTRLFGPSAGFVAGLFYALYAPAIHYDVTMLRGPWIVLTALLSAFLLIEFRSRPDAIRAGCLGLVAGLAVLVNEGAVTLAVLAGLVLARWLPASDRPQWKGGAFLLGFALALAPVVARNLLVGVPPLKLAVTGSTVFAVFNAAGANPHFFDVPRPDLGALIARSQGTVWGAVRSCLESFHGDWPALFWFYFRKSLGMIVPYENPDNVSFYYACLKSPLLRALPDYGVLMPLSAAGLLVAAARPERLLPLLPAGASLLFSIMITLPLSRYRATFVALLVPLLGLAVATFASWLRERKMVRLAAAALGMLLAATAARAVQARVVFGGKPAGHYLYRPVEFWIGSQIYQGRGRYALAASELAELARLNPDAEVKASALLSAAWYQTAAGRVEQARASLETLVGDNANDAKTLMSAGDSFRDLLHDERRALQCYRMAAERRPPEALLEQLREREQALGGRGR